MEVVKPDKTFAKTFLITIFPQIYKETKLLCSGCELRNIILYLGGKSK